jgi:hypothetical protein
MIFSKKWIKNQISPKTHLPRTKTEILLGFTEAKERFVGV